MNCNKKELAYTEGRLPAAAPLANPYVPFQSENPKRYASEKGFIRGTLYPGLDLPFMDMVNQKEKPVTLLSQLQVTAFAINELALYLDTHRDDRDALELYTAYQQQYQKQKEAYERKCGPLTHGSVNVGSYQWLDDPWPWEYAKNREV